MFNDKTIKDDIKTALSSMKWVDVSDFMAYDGIDNFDEQFPLTHLHVHLIETNEATCEDGEDLWKVWEFVDYQTNEKCWVKFVSRHDSYSTLYRLKEWNFVEKKIIVTWSKV